MAEGRKTQAWTIWLSALCLCMAASATQAMPIKWRSSNFTYVVNGKPLKDVLRDFGASQGMVVTVGADVDGTVVGKFDLTPRQFIDLLALSYGFVYYYNGAVLHFSASQGMRSTLIRLQMARVESLRQTLDRLNVSEPRFPIVYDEKANTALVVGPQEYVDVIREVAVQLEKRTGVGGRTVTQVFPLRFAWAADRQPNQGESQPGMASILRSLYAPASNGAGENPGSSHAETMDALVGIKGGNASVAPTIGSAVSERALDTGSLSLRKSLNLAMKPAAALPGIGQGDSRSTSFAATSSPGKASGESGGLDDTERRQDENLPVILADTASNSVIVRDLPERMPAYQALIASLDTQPQMVEIAVKILDIAENALTEVGVDWSGRSNRLTVRSGDDSALSSGGGVLTAVLGNSGRALLARIAVLEKTGQARISSRPKVATLNNVAAVMSSEKTFYVKVPGYQSSSLFNVSAGLDMKVTPMATMGPDGYRIRLDVQVTDGQISTTESVGDLPTVTRSQLGTQAFVRQNESLLLAGYTVERSGKSQGGIPLLADIPLVGALFRQRTTESVRTERLFLVTPRVMD